MKTRERGLPDEATDYAMLFNVLHAEQPETLLREAWRVLRPLGQLGIMHWNYDPFTPRRSFETNRTGLTIASCNDLFTSRNTGHG